MKNIILMMGLLISTSAMATDKLALVCSQKSAQFAVTVSYDTAHGTTTVKAIQNGVAILNLKSDSIITSPKLVDPKTGTSTYEVRRQKIFSLSVDRSNDTVHNGSISISTSVISTQANVDDLSCVFL